MSNKEILLFDTKSRKLQPLVSSNGKNLSLNPAAIELLREKSHFNDNNNHEFNLVNIDIMKKCICEEMNYDYKLVQQAIYDYIFLGFLLGNELFINSFVCSILSSKFVNLNSPLGVRYLSSSFFILSNRLFVTLPLAAISFISSTLIHSHLLLHVKHINVTKTPLAVMLKPFIIVSMSLVCNCMYGSLLSSFIFTFLVIVSWKASNYEILFLK